MIFSIRISIRKLIFAVASLTLMWACGQSQSGRQPTGTQQNQTAAHAGSERNPTTENATTQTTGQAASQMQVPPHGQTSAAGDPASVIPEFTFYILKSGIRFEKTDLKQGDKHVFILFDPGCTYCQYEARDIGKNFDKFENTSFYFVSMNDPALMATFFSTYAKELDNQPNVHMLYDRNVHFVNKFHVPSQFPATYVYNDKHLLENYWNGLKSAEEVVRSIVD